MTRTIRCRGGQAGRKAIKRHTRSDRYHERVRLGSRRECLRGPRSSSVASRPAARHRPATRPADCFQHARARHVARESVARTHRLGHWRESMTGASMSARTSPCASAVAMRPAPTKPICCRSPAGIQKHHPNSRRSPSFAILRQSPGDDNDKPAWAPFSRAGHHGVAVVRHVCLRAGKPRR